MNMVNNWQSILNPDEYSVINHQKPHYVLLVKTFPTGLLHFPTNRVSCRRGAAKQSYVRTVLLVPVCLFSNTQTLRPLIDGNEIYSAV